MSLSRKLRNVQDRARNHGWRIQWIPWQEPGKPEFIYNTKLTLLTGFGGAAMFLGGILYFAYQLQSPNTEPVDAVIAGALPISGLVLIILGRIYAAIRKQMGWKEVNARCIDHEINQVYSNSDGVRSVSYDFRLLCTFPLKGQEYTVTPESSHNIAFKSEDGVKKYLGKHIDSTGKCILWVDPQNPLHTIFNKKQRI